MRLYNFLVNKGMKIFFTFGLLLASTVYATDGVDCSEHCPDSRVQIGGSYTYVDCKLSDKYSFTGNLGGVQGSYEYKPWHGFYGALAFDWKKGETKHSSAHSRLEYIDVQERLGYTLISCRFDWTVTFFSGFGYRYISHEFKKHLNPHINFDYNEFYVPVGFLSEYSFTPCWALGLNLTWMPQVYSTVEIKPFKGVRWNLKNTLGNVLVELPLTYRLAEDSCFSLIMKPFYERWEDGRSIAKSDGPVLYLPKNTYDFWGVKFNFLFFF